ncbi:MAG: hypothetical protein Q8K85_23170, partial [Hyphomicrobium sp.]|nr:hypothetical protein [Hyphomicrobium sp.]
TKLMLTRLLRPICSDLVRRKAGAVLAMGVEKELKYELNIPAGFLPVPGTPRQRDYGNEQSAGGISVGRRWREPAFAHAAAP